MSRKKTHCKTLETMESMSNIDLMGTVSSRWFFLQKIQKYILTSSSLSLEFLAWP